MLRVASIVGVLLIVSSTSSAHDVRRLSIAPRRATAIVSPLLVVELPLGAVRFDVLSTTMRQRVRTLGGAFGSSRIVVLRTIRPARALPRVVRSRIRGRTLLLRRR